MSTLGHQIGILVCAMMGVRPVSRQENRVGYVRTFKHRVADIVMGADIAPCISNRVKEPVRSGETGRDAEQIRSGGVEATNRVFVIHEELGNRQHQKTKVEF